MKYLIFLILGPLLIFIGRKTRSRILEKRSKGYAAMLILSFLWLSVQVAGVMYEMLKVQYDVSPGLTPFNFLTIPHGMAPSGSIWWGWACTFWPCLS